MAPTDPTMGTAPFAGIAEPHQSTVAVILRSVGLGLFTAAEADMLIDRVRAHVVAEPVPVAVVPIGQSYEYSYGGSSATITGLDPKPMIIAGRPW